MKNKQEGLFQLEKLFVGKERFCLTKRQVEHIFNIELKDKQYHRLHKFLHLCGIAILSFPKVELFGFMRIKEMYQWERIDIKKSKRKEIV